MSLMIKGGVAFGISLVWHGVIIMMVLHLKSAFTVQPPRPLVHFEMATIPHSAPHPLEPPPVVRLPPPQSLPSEPEQVVKEVVKEVVLPTEKTSEPEQVVKKGVKKPVPPTAEKKAPVQKPVKVRKEPQSRSVPSVPAEAAPALSSVGDVMPPPRSVTTPPAPQVDTYRPPDVQAAYTTNPKPVYPPSARRMGYEGTVLLKVEITESGGVARVTIATGSGFDALDRAALTAVNQWRFVPAQRNGQPMAATVTVPIRFQLQTE
ncbi:MAG: energy transducer TonB [Magnetococcus sp. YQC-5]